MAFSVSKVNKITADWKTGDYTIRGLAKRHKVGKSTIEKYCKKQDKGNTAELVDAIQKVEMLSKTKGVQEVNAATAVAKKRTLQEEMNDDTIKKSTAILNQVSNAGFKKVVKSAEKMEVGELHEYAKLAERSIRAATPKEEKVAPTSTINIANLMDPSEATTTATTHAKEMTEEELIAAFRARGLPY